MTSATASIPRFLLPQSGLIWRRGAVSATASASVSPSRGRILLRLASSSSSNANPAASSGPRVLAKPERFNPPSHGSRLPKRTTPRHYGGDLSFEEASAQVSREYPGLPPPPNTFAHWFLHNRWIHVVITVGTLTVLAIYTFALSFSRTSPFADMLPAASDYLYHPILSTRTLIEVLRLHEAHKTERINEKRRRNVEDVAKRAAYRRAHGLPDEMGLFNQPMAKIRTDDHGVEDASPKRKEEEAPLEGGATAVEANGNVGGGEGGVADDLKGSDARRLTEQEQKAVVDKTKGKWLGIF
ncbi:hypothetical protein C7999DRAFT_17951 [Corynascus novoguineensis]|uniref:Uncharacterized protein n=1 Tax=Corynascus novoguineensis TaxID=1126955 RepID=A0AAN7CL15_9PEZI|nr:hypothetical protein C7999DRAFT_17951 [Corynascus novoguineensis]